MTEAPLPPRSLASYPSQLEKAQRDGLIYIHPFDGIHEDTIDRVCEKIWFEKIKTPLIEFAPNELALLRHWPWIALACDQLRSAATMKDEQFSAPMSPSEVKEALLRISKDARRLANDLCRLNDQSFFSLGEPTRERQGHLAWLSQYLAQTIDGRLQTGLDDAPDALFRGMQAQSHFVGILADLSATAEHLHAERLKPSLLQRQRSQDDPGLTTFVRRMAQVWESLTGRVASANKVNGGDDPDFVRFVRAAASVATTASISRSKVETALR